MKVVYPAIFTVDGGGICVYVPDLDINTQGEDMAQAIEMCRDAIGLMGIDMEDEARQLPQPTDWWQVLKNDGEIVTLVDVDLVAYRRANEQRSVRRNVTLPSWLNAKADEAGINVSAVLQSALKQELNL